MSECTKCLLNPNLEPPQRLYRRPRYSVHSVGIGQSVQHQGSNCNLMSLKQPQPEPVQQRALIVRRLRCGVVVCQHESTRTVLFADQPESSRIVPTRTRLLNPLTILIVVITDAWPKTTTMMTTRS
jgi:hypothetical protein